MKKWDLAKFKMYKCQFNSIHFNDHTALRLEVRCKRMNVVTGGSLRKRYTHTN